MWSDVDGCKYLIWWCANFKSENYCARQNRLKYDLWLEAERWIHICLKFEWV